MKIVCAPSVALAAVIASRSEIPSGPGLALRAVAEETSPLTMSLDEVTTSIVAATSVAVEVLVGVAVTVDVAVAVEVLAGVTVTVVAVTVKVRVSIRLAAIAVFAFVVCVATTPGEMPQAATNMRLSDNRRLRFIVTCPSW